MQQLLNGLNKGKILIVTGLAAFTMAIGVVATAPPKAAAAVSCRVFTAKTAENGYAGGRVASETYTVPYWSGCKDINVRNISAKDEDGNTIVGDYTASFTVQFFHSNGTVSYGQTKQVKSQGPNGPVVPIATNVLNGTKYRVLHNVEELGRTHSYQIVD